jgi:hypothetical protein
MRQRKILLILAISVILLGACAGPTPIPSVPDTSASVITSPPPSMEGINTHTQVYGTGTGPNMITLGPKVGGHHLTPDLAFEVLRNLCE